MWLSIAMYVVIVRHTVGQVNTQMQRHDTI